MIPPSTVTATTSISNAPSVTLPEPTNFHVAVIPVIPPTTVTAAISSPSPTSEANDCCVTSQPDCVSVISDCYDVAVYWRPNLFLLPTGRVGELFIKELCRLFSNYANVSSLESVTFKAAFLFPRLILQRTSAKLRTKLISSHIDRRLSLWHQGAFSDLLPAP